MSTTGISTLTGIGGRIRAGTFTNKAGTGAPQLTFGAEIPVGYGLTGAGGINVGGAATISGNLTVGGVLTYDDVTNVDSLVLLPQDLVLSLVLLVLVELSPQQGKQSLLVLSQHLV